MRYGSLVAAVLLALGGLLKLSRFQYGFDTAVLGNVIWRLAHGYDSTTALTGFPHLADHPSFALLALTPVSVVAGPWILHVLFVLQASSVAMAGWFVWRLGRLHGLTQSASAAIWLATTFGSGAWFAGTGEIHLVSLALGPLAAAVFYGSSDRPKAAVAWALLAATVRVELAIAVALLGVVLWSISQERVGKLLGASGIAAAASLLVVGASVRGGGSGIAAHLGHLGTTGHDILSAIVEHPGTVLTPLRDPVMWLAVFFWTAAFGIVPVVAGARWLLPALPLVAIPVLGSWGPADNYFEHYWHVLLVFGAVASIHALARAPARQHAGAALIIAGATITFALFGPQHSGLPGAWGLPNSVAPHSAAGVMGVVGETAPLSAPIGLLPSLVSRPQLEFFPRPFSCTGSENILPHLGVPSEPPDWVVAGVAWPSVQDPVRVALRSSYVLAAETDSLQVWRLERPEPARRAMVACSDDDPIDRG